MSDSSASAHPPAQPEIPGPVQPAEPTADAAAVPEAVPHAGVRYAVLRLALLVTVGGLLYLVGMRGWALLFVAVLASGVLSFFVFLRQREAAARSLEARLHAARHHGPADDHSAGQDPGVEPAATQDRDPDPASPDPDEPAADRHGESAAGSRTTSTADPPPTAP